jgi:hypothetical protein
MITTPTRVAAARVERIEKIPVLGLPMTMVPAEELDECTEAPVPVALPLPDEVVYRGDNNQARKTESVCM